MCSERQAFLCLVGFFDGLTECCNSGISVPTLLCADFFLRAQTKTQLRLRAACRYDGKRAGGQSHGENHDAGKAKELEKEYHEKMKKCFED